VTITEKASCWTGCALYEKGCYAFYGALSHFWSRVSDGTPGGSWDELCANVAALPKSTLWRYAQAGDLPGADDAVDAELMWQLVIANRGKRVIAFTHKPVLPDTPTAARNRCIIAIVNTLGFTIRLSANNPAEADALADLGIAPVVTIIAHDYARRAVRHRAKRRSDEWAETIGEWRGRIADLPRHTPAGRRIAICPATYTDATCESCGACAAPRDAVIGFPAHGAWRMVEKATAARDVPTGESWASGSIGRWPKSSPRRRPQQPDAFSLPIRAIGRHEAPEHPAPEGDLGCVSPFWSGCCCCTRWAASRAGSRASSSSWPCPSCSQDVDEREPRRQPPAGLVVVLTSAG
jgi:hypothetical protein